MMECSETVVHILEHLPAEVHSPAYVWELLLHVVSKQVNSENYWFNYVWVTLLGCVTQLGCLEDKNLQLLYLLMYANTNFPYLQNEKKTVLFLT